MSLEKTKIASPNVLIVNTFAGAIFVAVPPYFSTHLKLCRSYYEGVYLHILLSFPTSPVSAGSKAYVDDITKEHFGLMYIHCYDKLIRYRYNKSYSNNNPVKGRK